LGAYATAHKTATDLTSVSRYNGESFNWVPNNNSKSGGSKRSSGTRRFSDKNTKRELVLAEDSQQYARVTKRLGDGRFEALCCGDGVTRLAHVRGKMWKRVWVAPHDIVLVALRNYQDQKADIVHRYTDDEVRTLSKTGEMPLAALARPQEDEGYESALQAVRDVHGSVRAGFIPDEETFGFCDDADDEVFAAL